VGDDGAIHVSEPLDADAIEVLGLNKPLPVGDLADGHRAYLARHRDRVFEKTNPIGPLPKGVAPRPAG
jgi:hypothetical protein